VAIKPTGQTPGGKLLKSRQIATDHGGFQMNDTPVVFVNDPDSQHLRFFAAFAASHSFA
jgi:hypothetical protein